MKDVNCLVALAVGYIYLSDFNSISISINDKNILNFLFAQKDLRLLYGNRVNKAVKQ